ncbi:MAG TPA: hypothetical protein VFG35_32570 [Actinoplanes sp.]|nr:hypothetical protein [Actinoplanes sp.]
MRRPAAMRLNVVRGDTPLPQVPATRVELVEPDARRAGRAGRGTSWSSRTRDEPDELVERYSAGR